MILQILRRHCAIWDPNIGRNGSWNVNDVRLVKIDSFTAVCEATRTGTFAIIAEKLDIPSVPDEPAWLTQVKFVGYGFSLVLLLIFILVISFSPE